jgi:hypothetical protein
MLEYVSDDGKIHYHFRGKGLNTKELSVKSFDDMDVGKSLKNIRPFAMKKIHVKRNRNQIDIPQFSIVHQTEVARVVNKSAWRGRNFIDNVSVPHGCNYFANGRSNQSVLSACEIEQSPVKNDIVMIKPFDRFVNGKEFYFTIEDAMLRSRGNNIMIGRDVMFKGKDRPTRQFATFCSYKEYFEWLDGVSDRHFHEIIRDNEQRRLFIDFDRKIDGWYNNLGLVIVNATIESVFRKAIESAFSRVFDGSINASTDIHFSNNSRPGKLSYHIMLRNHVGKGGDNKRFAQAVRDELVTSDDVIVRDENVDMAVYGTLKSLRMPGSSKLGCDAYPKPESDMLLKNFVRATVVNAKVQKVTVKRDDCSTSKVAPNDLQRLMVGNDLFKEHRFRSIKGSLASFTRLNESHCDLCNRTHNADNTLYLLKQGTQWKRGCTRAKGKLVDMVTPKIVKSVVVPSMFPSPKAYNYDDLSYD